MLTTGNVEMLPLARAVCGVDRLLRAVCDACAPNERTRYPVLALQYAACRAGAAVLR